ADLGGDRVVPARPERADPRGLCGPPRPLLGLGGARPGGSGDPGDRRRDAVQRAGLPPSQLAQPGEPATDVPRVRAGERRARQGGEALRARTDAARPLPLDGRALLPRGPQARSPARGLGNQLEPGGNGRLLRLLRADGGRHRRRPAHARPDDAVHRRLPPGTAGVPEHPQRDRGPVRGQPLHVEPVRVPGHPHQPDRASARARRASLRAGGGSPVRGRGLPLSRCRGLGAEARVALHSPRPEPGAGGAERRREDDVHQAPHPALRAHRGQDPPRREGPPDLGGGDAAPADRRHLPGLQPVPVPIPGERGIRERGPLGGRGAPGAGGGARRRGRGAPDVARGAGDAPRPVVQGGHGALRGSVAEGGAGPGLHARGGGHPGARRADRGAGCRGRARHLRALPAVGPRADHAAHLPPLLDSAAGRPHRGDRAGEDRRAGDARGADRARWTVRASLHLAGQGLPMTVHAACFDLLSALLDSWTVWDGVAASLGRADVGRAWRGRYLELTSTVGAYRPYLALVGEAAAAVGLPEEAAARLERAWDGLRPWPDVLPALGSLAVPAAVVTSGSLAMGRRAASCVGGPFEVVVTAEEAGAYKPDPAPYRLACERLGRAPREVAFVAGSPFDARGALAFGFQVTWVNRLGAPVPADLSGARVVPTLEGWR